MATIRDLVVRIAADASRLRSEVSGAMRTLRGFGSAATKIVAGITKAFIGLATAAAGFATAITVNAGAIREMARLSEVTGVSLENMQKWTFAAKSLGIESDKMGDIFKDVSDKLGDFLVTGGGAASDMFEKLNINAKDFIGLSPDESLLKIGRALDGLTQNEKIFFMEAIASDASHLLPLLENNAAALRELGDEAERSGNVLNDSGVQAAVGLSEAWENLTNMAKGFFKQITALAAPALTKIFEHVKSTIDEFGGIERVANLAAIGVLEFVRSGLIGIQSLMDKIGSMELLWLRTQIAILATGEAIAKVGNMLTPSVWGQALGLDFKDTDLQKVEQNLSGAAGMVADQLGTRQAELAGRGNVMDGPVGVVSELIADLENKLNIGDKMDESIDRLIEQNESLFGRESDKWDKLVDAVSNRDEVAVKLDLRTDAGNLVGKVTGSREFAQAVQSLASQAINNTARGVAA